jgi:hypothetical protein
MIDKIFLQYFDNMINNQDILNFKFVNINQIDQKKWEEEIIYGTRPDHFSNL